MAFLFIRLSAPWLKCRRISSYQHYSAYFEYFTIILAFQPHDRRNMEKCFCRGFLRAPPSSCGIGCLDCRTQRCYEFVFRDAYPLPLCLLYRKTCHQKIYARCVFFPLRSHEQAHGCHPACAYDFTGLLAAGTSSTWGNYRKPCACYTSSSKK